MFVVDTAVLLPHPPHVVARVVARLGALPRWCAGLRRVRAPDAGGADAEWVFAYAAADVRLTLRARTLAEAPGAPAGRVRHRAEGDGIALTWTLAVEPDASGAVGPLAPGEREGPAGGAGGAAGPRSWLRVHTALEVDPGHPTAAVRVALCRVVARRAPTDLERLRTVLGRARSGRAALGTPGVDRAALVPEFGTLAPRSAP
jgi:hypothetical protein